MFLLHLGQLYLIKQYSSGSFSFAVKPQKGQVMLEKVFKDDLTSSLLEQEFIK